MGAVVAGRPTSGMARDRRSEARQDRSFSPVAFVFQLRSDFWPNAALCKRSPPRPPRDLELARAAADALPRESRAHQIDQLCDGEVVRERDARGGDREMGEGVVVEGDRHACSLARVRLGVPGFGAALGRTFEAAPGFLAPPPQGIAPPPTPLP